MYQDAAQVKKGGKVETEEGRKVKGSNQVQQKGTQRQNRLRKREEETEDGGKRKRK